MKYFAESELIINPDGSIFHLHVKPEQLADKIILVGDPGRVALVIQAGSSYNEKEVIKTCDKYEIGMITTGITHHKN